MTAIVVVLPHVVGEITAIDGSTITVTQPGGTTATIHVDSDTTYAIAGAAGSLSDLKVGAVIVAEGTQRSDGSLDADVDRQRAQGRARTPRLPGRPRSRQGPGRQPGPVERRELIERGLASPWTTRRRDLGTLRRVSLSRSSQGRGVQWD